MNTISRLTTVAMVLTLAACGGGGGSSSPPPVTEEPPTPPPPGLLMPAASEAEFVDSLRSALTGADYVNSSDNLVVVLDELGVQVSADAEALSLIHI